MKTLILGGGPGGLYAAILLKKANPAHDIYIVERNPAGATYGWGVVFSDRTINTFREADFPSYERITQEFVTWTAIDIHYKGEIIRADGHDFAGMSRRRLLQILQERCRELDIQMTFEHEGVIIENRESKIENRDSVDTDFRSSIFDQETTESILKKITADRTFAPGVIPLPITPSDYDLLIAADGVNSAIRTQFADIFQPTLTVGKTKFIWFGTTRLLDAFTFLFKENEHGLFQVHAYPFDGTTSTFIVECAEDVWRRAGLDTATEADSIAYCQTLFADFLGKASLLSNRSLWVNFVHVVCKKWRHTLDGTPLILLGDAAHTAHFSIGSGTKLAMDAAIALAQALETTPDIPSALRPYEMDRRPRAESLQAAALVSQRYFETLKRYTHLPPQPFAFQLLTRSGRIHYDNLRTRDPHYADTLDRDFAGTPLAPPPMHTPFTIRDLSLPNRLASRNPDSGAGLLLTPPVAVSPEGRITPDDPCLYSEIHFAQWKTFVDAAHARGQKTGILLNHAGRRGAVHPARAGVDRPLRDPWPLIAPSPIPFHRHSQTPREMTPEDLTAVCNSFVRAARLAEQAGFDLLQLHMAHGYLLASFLSPLTNHRPDEYGGTPENRLRYPLQILTAIRTVWNGPLAVTLTVDDWAKGGLTLEDSLDIARALQPHIDLLQPLAGQTLPNDDPIYSSGYLAPYAERLRHSTGLPILVGGHLTTSGEVNTILAGGRADLCIMAS